MGVSIRAEFIEAARAIYRHDITAGEIEQRLGPEFIEHLSARTIRDYSFDAIRAIKATVTKGLVVVISDVHVPFHNVRGMENMVQLCADWQPEYFVINGDFLDCLGISTFLKPPNGPQLQDELNAALPILRNLREAMPLTKMVWTDGNHEQRMERTIMANPGLYGMHALEMRQLVELDRIDCEYRKYMEPYHIGDLTLVHGNRVSKHSAYSAKATLIDSGFKNVMIGHTHRQGIFKHAGGMGVRRAAEIGGMFDINQVHYIAGRPNWQAGFGVAHMDGDTCMDMQLIEMADDGSFIFNGVVYR